MAESQPRTVRFCQWTLVYGLAVFMTVMEIGIVRVPVPKRLMPVPVRMRLGHRPFVSMAMMFVVDMAVLVLDRLVRVFVAVPFGQMKPDAERHQHAGNDQLRRDRLMDEGNRDDRAKEWREREISASCVGLIRARKRGWRRATNR